ncbi:hypothetical protein A3734_18430 [Sulfitobacter sp. HI0054]|uniref:hypothetical protein n=1 Tax=Sulfitobacter sp. HI0054 TaxID=1822238 RepID=UPI0007C30E25|nr:hypothetical protein [Sulfitobacter sp. HI0054]KZY52612.1 hypothetical protein A3734_18430 [Sulfitobacter sp. HI0054]
MLPTVKLHSDADVLKHSPLVRGMTLALRYANETGGIGLTQSGAFNRKFVHWAAEHFEWPDFTATELFEMNKVLDEYKMPPGHVPGRGVTSGSAFGGVRALHEAP